MFTGDLSQSVKEVFANIGKRFTFGGEIPKDQRVYYFNTREIVGNKYGTPAPVPFRVVDEHANIDMDIAVRCFGEYSYRITNPLLFYTNVCGNVEKSYTRSQLDSQMKSELLTALQPAFGRISRQGIRYSSLPAHTLEVGEALNRELSAKWRDTRGVEIVNFGISGLKADEEDERIIKELQRTAALKDPDMRAAHYVNATAAAMQSAAANESAGPSMAFMGMNMAQNAAGSVSSELFQSHAAAPAGAGDSWSAPSAARLVPPHPIPGPARNAARPTRAGSAPNAARKSPPAFPSTAATSADGSRPIPLIHPNSVPSAAIPSTTATSSQPADALHKNDRPRDPKDRGAGFLSVPVCTPTGRTGSPPRRKRR